MVGGVVDSIRKAGICRVRVLYVGPHADQLRDIFENHPERIEPAYAARADEALFLSRNYDFDAVIMDQRDAALATRLILPLVACFDRPVSLLVISALSEAEAYRKIPGSARVIPLPLREAALLRALDVQQDIRPPTHVAASIAPKIESPVPKTVPIASFKGKFPSWGVQNTVFSTFGVAAFAILLAVSGGLLKHPVRDTSTVAVVATEQDQPEVSKTDQLNQRIEKARNTKEVAQFALEKAQDHVKSALVEIRKSREATVQGAAKAERKSPSLTRERDQLVANRGHQRNLKDLRKRQAAGLLDDVGVKTALSRLLAADERIAELDLALAGQAASSDRARRDVKVLDILIANLAGKPGAVPRPVSDSLLPLVKLAAHAVQDHDHREQELATASEILQLLLDKREQINHAAKSPKG